MITAEGKSISKDTAMVNDLLKKVRQGLTNVRTNYDSYVAGAEVKGAQDGKVRKMYEETRRLSTDDLDEYLKAVSRRNIKKAEAVANGEKVILSTEAEITEFINNSIEHKTGTTVVAYGRVNNRLADEVSSLSKGKIDITDYFLELVPNNIYHAYNEHNKPKNTGDIELTNEDFKKIPQYLDGYSEVLYAIKYDSGKVNICVSKKLPNERILIIETVSKSRSSLQLKNIIGVSEGKYQNEYLKKYKKRAEVNTRGSDSSNISLRDNNDFNSIISEPDEFVKDNSSTDSDGELKQHLYSEAEEQAKNDELEALREENKALKQKSAQREADIKAKANKSFLLQRKEQLNVRL